jgi:cytochrome oxidase Cu insertion factor (SCO1/SenC/PrrC family)
MANENTRRPQSARSLKLALGLAGVAGVALVGATLLEARSEPQQPSKTQNAAITYSSPHSYSKPVTAAKTVALGQEVPDFSFTDLSSQTRQLSQWRGKMTLIFFADTTCPCVQAYNGRMEALRQKFEGQGLRIAYVFPQIDESRAQIQKLAASQKYPWPCIPDPDQKLLRLFNAQCTTEAFLIDAQGRLRYHGHVDESTFAPGEAKQHDLQDAIVALLAGQPVKRPETSAYACTIMRKPAAAQTKSATAKPTTL